MIEKNKKINDPWFLIILMQDASFSELFVIEFILIQRRTQINNDLLNIFIIWRENWNKRSEAFLQGISMLSLLFISFGNAARARMADIICNIILYNTCGTLVRMKLRGGWSPKRWNVLACGILKRPNFEKRARTNAHAYTSF